MGKSVGQLWIEMGADVARLRKDMGEATGVVNKFHDEVESAFSKIKTAALAYLSFQGMKQAYEVTIKAAADEERQLLSLEAVLRAHGVTNKEVTRIYNDMANEMQMTTRYTDDEIRSAQRLLTTLGVQPSKMKEVINASSQLAVLTGNLDSAAQALGLAYHGNYRRLRLLIPEIANAKKGELDLNDILKMVRDNFGDIAQREMDGYSGQVNQFEKEWKEFGETLGTEVLPALTHVLKTLNDISANGISKSIGNFLLQDVEGEDPAVRASKTASRAALNGATDGKAYWDEWAKKAKEENDKLALQIESDNFKYTKIEKEDTAAIAKAKRDQETLDDYYNTVQNYLEDLALKREKAAEDAATKERERMYEQAADDLRLQREGMVESWKLKEQQIEAINELELQSIELQRQATQELFSELQSMAQFAGGEGAGKMVSGLQGITNSLTGEDEWSNKLTNAQSYYDALKELHGSSLEDMVRTQEAYDSLTTLQKQAAYARTTKITSSAFGMMAGAALQYYNSTGQQDKKAFAIYKALAIAETIIATIGATQQAYEVGLKTTKSMGGGVAFAAVAAAVGAARVAQLASTNPEETSYRSDSGYASPSIAESNASTVQDKTRSQNINIYVYGSVVDHQKFARQIVTELNQAESDRVH